MYDHMTLVWQGVSVVVIIVGVCGGGVCRHEMYFKMCDHMTQGGQEVSVVVIDVGVCGGGVRSVSRYMII